MARPRDALAAVRGSATLDGLMTEPSTAGAPRTSDPSIGQIFMEDLQRMKLRSDYLRELRQLYHFYLDDESRGRLAAMGRVRRAVSLVAWLLKSLFLKLSPARRLLLVAASALTMLGETQVQKLTIDFRPTGFIVLLVVLMLELKDKLLARDEIAIARQVQLALLPRRPPEIPGWEVWSSTQPANDVGGDLVDYIELDGFRHGIVLGDVAGKGLGAALLSAKLQATLRAVLPDVGSLDELGRRVNAIFYSKAFDNRYATLFFAQLEHDSGQLRYLNAGHHPPLVIRADSVEKLGASSYPLGMLATAEYAEGALELDPGDVLLAYSDGLTEALNEHDEDFGLARLEALIPELRRLDPTGIGERILDEVGRFLGETRPTDDLSLVVVRKGMFS